MNFASMAKSAGFVLLTVAAVYLFQKKVTKIPYIGGFLPGGD